FTGSAAGWGSLLDQFASTGLRIIALDLHGHGQTDSPEDYQRYSIESCQVDILAALAQLQVEPGEACLLGYSMGGRIALYTAFSGFFKSLILESTSPGLATEEERKQRRASDEALASRIEDEGLAGFVAYWEHIPLFASQRSLPSSTQQNLHNQRLHNNPRGLANSLCGVGTGSQPDLRARLPELHIPVLLITGELDQKFSKLAREMQTALPQAIWHEIPQAGHTVHLEQPATFVSLVTDFLAQAGK
ncbi:MAG TPA: 2-succinyl-6-hydroxy-2,4-cyclohexadiene-1-carboxylate synthase, partial [Ktedonobacteraceae bacterium]|nr:2-succinyl-6-hydroxy-2,4-cyclohexadiene-1-carboxylate synthase [Ktedonobacteraceae bacterium]